MQLCSYPVRVIVTSVGLVCTQWLSNCGFNATSYYSLSGSMPFNQCHWPSKTSFSQPIFATEKEHSSKLNLLDWQCNISTNQQHIIRQDHHIKSGTAVGIRKCKRRKRKEEEEMRQKIWYQVYLPKSQALQYISGNTSKSGIHNQTVHDKKVNISSLQKQNTKLVILLHWTMTQFRSDDIKAQSSNSQ